MPFTKVRLKPGEHLKAVRKKKTTVMDGGAKRRQAGLFGQKDQVRDGISPGGGFSWGI